MARALEVILAFLVTVLLFVTIALFLPSHAHVERNIEVGNPLTQVHDILNGFKRYNTWQPWLSPLAKYDISGSEFGEGAKFSWKSIDADLGNGALEITDSEPDSHVIMRLDNDWRGDNKVMAFELQQNPQTNAVMIRWSFDVDYGWDLIGRFSGLYLDGHIGDTMNSGLAKLASFVATIPNVDYSQVEVQLAEVEAVDLLYVNAITPSAPKQWDEAETIMNQAWSEVHEFVTRNNLETIGMPLRIINILGDENNDLDFALAVQPHNAAVSGNVRIGTSYAGRVLTTQYHGHRVGLGKSRDMLKAYAITHGYAYDPDLAGSWEEWEPVTDLDNPQYLTNLYLPIH